MHCGLATRRYFQGIWCLECCAGCQPAGTLNPQLLSRHLVLEMHCGLPTRRYFHGIWCLKCPAGCQPAGAFKPFGAWNPTRSAFEAFALRAANPQVLSRHLVLEMLCGLPTRRYFQGIWCLKCTAACQPAAVLSRHLVLEMVCGLPTRRYFQQVLSRHLVLEMLCGLHARRYFQGICCLERCAGCQPTGTFKAFGA